MASWPTWRAGGAARVRSPAGRRAGVKCRPSPRTRSPLIDQVNFPSGQTSLFRSRMWGRAGLAVATFASSRRWRSAGAAAPERAEPDPAGPLPLGQQSPVIRNPDSMKNAYTGSRRAASPDGRGRRARRRPRRRGYRPRPAGDASRHGTRRVRSARIQRRRPARVYGRRVRAYGRTRAARGHHGGLRWGTSLWVDVSSNHTRWGVRRPGPLTERSTGTTDPSRRRISTTQSS